MVTYRCDCKHSHPGESYGGDRICVLCGYLIVPGWSRPKPEPKRPLARHEAEPLVWMFLKYHPKASNTDICNHLSMRGGTTFGRTVLARMIRDTRDALGIVCVRGRARAS